MYWWLKYTRATGFVVQGHIYYGYIVLCNIVYVINLYSFL